MDEAVSLSGVLIDRAGAPTLVRAFARTDIVTASLQLRRQPVAAGPITVTIRIVDTQDLVAFESIIPLDDATFAGTRVAEVRNNLPLSELAPGEYLLTMGIGDAKANRNVRLIVR